MGESPAYPPLAEVRHPFPGLMRMEGYFGNDFGQRGEYDAQSRTDIYGGRPIAMVSRNLLARQPDIASGNNNLLRRSGL